MKRRTKTTLLAIIGLLAAGGGIAYWAVHEHDEARERFGKVVPGVLYRSRQPEPDSAEQFTRRHIKTAVNLRPRHEDIEDFDWEVETCRSLGIEMVNLPMSDILPADDQLAEFLWLVEHRTGPVLVHCELGRARTGILVAAYRIVQQGWTAEAALAELETFGFKSVGETHERRLAYLQRLAGEKQKWIDVAAATTRPVSAGSSSSNAAATAPTK
jgi:protein tyrosine/serine phosphatase